MVRPRWRGKHLEGQPLHASAAEGPEASLRREQLCLEVQHLVPQVREVFLDLGCNQGEHLRFFCGHVVFHRQHQRLKRVLKRGAAGGQAPQVLHEGEGLLMLLQTGVHQAFPEARRFLFHRLGKDDCFALGVDFQRVKDVPGTLPLRGRILGRSIRPEELSHLLMIRVQGYPLKAGHRYTTMVSGLESRGRQ
jgi:hypothetical protein